MDKLNSILEASELILKGKNHQTKLVFANILSGGHTLIEDLPGVGKTTLAKLFGKILGLELSRIQFTNDLLPSDILGASIYSKEKERFEFHKGPLFNELILADELNRAPPKTQSALLQAMEEKSVSIEGNHFSLSNLFTVIATQNPQQQVGTFPLPESQLDRFSMKLKMGYANKLETLKLLKSADSKNILQKINSVLEREELSKLRVEVENIVIKDEIFETIYKILDISRKDSSLVSLSNRAGLDMVKVSKSWALLAGRNFVIPDDLFEIAPYVLGHRLQHREKSNIENGFEIVKKVLKDI